MNPNFILLNLGDNDCAEELEQAARLIATALGTGDIIVCGEGRLQEVVVDLTAALMNLRHAAMNVADHAGPTRQYLRTKLEVQFLDRLEPMPDHDGGSVGIDRTRYNYIWRF
jgi:hypothetical protein